MSIAMNVPKPRQYGGLQLWLSAKDPFANGTQPGFDTQIAYWNDKSPYRYQANQIGSAEFILNANNNLPAIRSNGTKGFFMMDAFALTANFTMFLVGQFSLEQPAFIEHSDNTNTESNGCYVYGEGTSPAVVKRDNTTVKANNIPANWMGDQPMIATVMYDGSTLSYYTNSSTPISKQGTLSNNYNIARPFYIGQHSDFTLLTQGDWNELIIYNYALTSEMAFDIEEFLRREWGIA